MNAQSLSLRQLKAVYIIMAATGTWPEDIKEFDSTGLPLFKEGSCVSDCYGIKDILVWFRAKNNRSMTIGEFIAYYDDCDLLAPSRDPNFKLFEFECCPPTGDRL